MLDPLGGALADGLCNSRPGPAAAGVAFNAVVGGEEFGVLLQGQSLDLAMRRAEEFRALCAHDPIQVGHLMLPITVSIGVAEVDPENHKDGDGLSRAADTAVYQAKHSGRNRVCSHEPEVA